MDTLDTPLTLLAGMTARTFLSEYWQKKPLLIRGGLKDFPLPLDADELAGLAMEEDVEARLVIEKGAQRPWQVMHGPFTEADYDALPEQEWTLLVQAVDHWVPEIQALKERFHFLPSWRLDDVMVSYATKGGSVGPHYDQYDVFLIQVSGARRWQIQPPGCYQDTAMSGIDLHILANFKADPALEWDLEAGDILYLPPNFAHNGRALDDDCMTYSVGFRAPSLQEILSGLHDQLLEQQDEKQRFCAPVDLSHPHHHAQIQAADLQYLQQQMTQMLQQPTRLLDWFGKRMSEVKYPDLQLILDEKQTEQALASARNGQAFFRPGDARICYGVAPDYPARLQVFCNGASIDISQELESLIQAICNEVDFDFGGLDFKAHTDITPLMRFLLQQQGLVELTQN